MKPLNACCLMFMILSAFHVSADKKEVLSRAYKEGALAKISCQVVDENLTPMSNVTVCVSFRSTVRSIADADFRLKTDCEGMAKVSHRTNWKVSCIVREEGFYESRFEVSFYDMMRNRVVNDEWVDDGLRRRIVLRRIYAKKTLTVFPEARRMGTWKIPVKNGLDLTLSRLTGRIHMGKVCIGMSCCGSRQRRLIIYMESAKWKCASRTIPTRERMLALETNCRT